MNFDFYSSYAEYNNVELLKIVFQKELYQPAAIEAAQQVLNSRQVTDSEREEAKAQINAPVLVKVKRKQRLEAVKNELANTAYRFFYPRQRNTVFYIKTFCIIYSIIWLVGSIDTFRAMLWDLQYGNYVFFSIVFLLQLGYVLSFYWLFKLDNKGWVLLMIYFSFISGFIINNLLGSYSSIPFIKGYDTFTLALTLAYCGLVLYYFNRREVLIVLKVRRRFYFRVLAASIIILLLNILRQQANLSYYLS